MSTFILTCCGCTGICSDKCRVMRRKNTLEEILMYSHENKGSGNLHTVVAKVMM